MKILIIHPASPRVEKLTQQLAVLGHELTIVHPFYTPPWLFKLAQHLPVVGKVLSNELARRLRSPLLSTANVRHAGMLEVFRALIYRLDKKYAGKFTWLEYEIMYRHHVKLGKVAAKLVHGNDLVYCREGLGAEPLEVASRAGIPTVLDYPITHHAFSRKLMTEESHRQPEFAGTLQWMSWPSWYEARMDLEVRLADRIHTGSQFAADSFIQEGIPEDKLIVEPYGVDTELFAPSPKGPQFRPFNVVFVGQIGQRKGVSYLLEGYRTFQKPDSRLTLVGNIVGNADVFDEYQSVFIHRPHVPKWEIPAILRSQSVFVFPSLNEGLGLALVEAMATGLPVIVTDRGPAEIVRDGVSGLIVPAGDASAIDQALERLYSDEIFFRTLSAGARRQAEQLSWVDYARRLSEHFQELVDGGSTAQTRNQRQNVVE